MTKVLTVEELCALPENRFRAYKNKIYDPVESGLTYAEKRQVIVNIREAKMRRKKIRKIL